MDKMPVEPASLNACSLFWDQLQECLDAGLPLDDDPIIAEHVNHCQECAERLGASKQMLSIFEANQHSSLISVTLAIPSAAPWNLSGSSPSGKDRGTSNKRKSQRQALLPALAAAACLLMLWMPAWWLRLSEVPTPVAFMQGNRASSGIGPSAGTPATAASHRDAARNSTLISPTAETSPTSTDAGNLIASRDSTLVAPAWISLDARMPLSRVLEISDALDAQLKDAGEMASAVQHVAWSSEGRWSVIPLQNPAPTLRAGLSPFTSSVGAALTTLRDTVLLPRSSSTQNSTSIPQVQSLAPARILG